MVAVVFVGFCKFKLQTEESVKNTQVAAWWKVGHGAGRSLLQLQGEGEGFACTACNEQQPAALALWDWVVLLLSFCPLFLLESCVGSAAGMGWFGARCLGDAGRAVLFGEVLACFGLEKALKILF